LPSPCDASIGTISPASLHLDCREVNVDIARFASTRAAFIGFQLVADRPRDLVADAG
jgi:hypothetical protein